MSALTIVTGPLPSPPKRVSFDEYYAAEVKAQTRSEWIDGVVRPMAGASEGHSAITSVLGEVVNPRLRARGTCRLRDQDTQIPIPAYDVYTYPDAVIACPPQYARKPRGALLNPKVIFEVLSPSTEGYDRGPKFRYYRSLETLDEYVLVSVDEPVIEVFPRASGWGVQTYEGLDAVARLESVGIDLPLCELYADVDFSTSTRKAEGLAA